LPYHLQLSSCRSIDGQPNTKAAASDGGLQMTGETTIFF